MPGLQEKCHLSPFGTNGQRRSSQGGNTLSAEALITQVYVLAVAGFFNLIIFF